MNRLIWFLVASLALLIIVLIFVLGTPNKPGIGGLTGAVLRDCAKQGQKEC